MRAGNVYISGTHVLSTTIPRNFYLLLYVLLMCAGNVYISDVHGPKYQKKIKLFPYVLRIRLGNAYILNMHVLTTPPTVAFPGKPLQNGSEHPDRKS